jgi:proteasome lid subunit RPN8/RPN11
MLPEAVEVMHDDARRGYPEEVCGILIGTDAGHRIILDAVPVANARQDERTRRYVIDAETLRRVEREAEGEGLSVIGFYHSHPDHPAVPSAFDREHSWPWYTYVIVAVRDGRVADTRAWQLAGDRAHFTETGIESFTAAARAHGQQTSNQSRQTAPETGTE